tara:strand:- start:1 stop:135 length:135 start_codon:yes stop_codon:yes gene_type:complete
MYYYFLVRTLVSEKTELRVIKQRRVIISTHKNKLENVQEGKKHN